VIVIRIFGVILMFVGLLLCLTIFGAVIGVPMMIVGFGMIVVSLVGRRKTVITNVVHVSNGAQPSGQGAAQSLPRTISADVEPPALTADPIRRTAEPTP